MKKLLRLLCLVFAAFIAIFAVACNNTGTDGTTAGTEAGSISDVSVEYTDKEQAIVEVASFDFTELSEDTEIPADATEIASSDTAVTLTGGTYVLSGEYTAGITVTAEKDTHIYLNGATISNAGSNALSVVKGDTEEAVSVTVTVVSGTVNRISNNKKNAVDSAIPLYINGGGTLDITTTGKSGIKVDGALKITDATVNISAANHGLSAYSVAAKDCTVNVSAAGKDGIHAEMDDSVTAWTVNDGYVVLNNVTYTADVQGDGIQADTFVYINGGTYNITTTATFVSYTEWAANPDNYDLTADDFRYAKSGTTYVKQSSKTITSSNVTSLYAMEQGTKGIKVGEIDYTVDKVEYTVTNGDYYILIDGGEFTINSADDGIHANCGNVTINGGIFTVSTLDDGITADLTAKINGGTITVSKCFEGIEGGYVVINGGTIALTCSDDGINAASDDTSVKEYIKIYGGMVSIDAQGDGIDSNSTAAIYGGTVYVFGPTGGGNSALDSEGSVLISGGTVVAISREAMDSITCNVPYVSATGVTLANGNTVSVDGVVSVTVPKSYSGATVIVCSEKLTSGTSYTLRLGTSTKTVTAQTGSQGGMGGGAFNPGGMGGRTRP